MSSVVAKEYNANDPNIAPFVGHGGKLLMWHGIDDPGPSAIATSEYYERVAQTVDSKLFASNVRYFRAPGVSHCGGGAGPDRIDPLTALETWVEQGKAPETLLATKVNSPKSWPLCAYPKLPYYKGKGDANDPKNYACK
jgi:feruloyl esterase